MKSKIFLIIIKWHVMSFEAEAPRQTVICVEENKVTEIVKNLPLYEISKIEIYELTESTRERFLKG